MRSYVKIAIRTVIFSLLAASSTLSSCSCENPSQDQHIPSISIRTHHEISLWSGAPNTSLIYNRESSHGDTREHSTDATYLAFPGSKENFFRPISNPKGWTDWQWNSSDEAKEKLIQKAKNICLAYGSSDRVSKIELVEYDTAFLIKTNQMGFELIELPGIRGLDAVDMETIERNSPELAKEIKEKKQREDDYIKSLPSGPNIAFFAIHCSP